MKRSTLKLSSSISNMQQVSEKVLKFSAAVRGFHYYQKVWSPKPRESLNCGHEVNNAFDYFAIKTEENKSGKIVGHLPREISRITKFILDRGAKVIAVLITTNYRRSPLVQGGLEIACEVTITMPATIKNQMILDQYKLLLNDFYVEPQNEEILGSFLEYTGTVAISTRKTNGRSTEGMPKTKKKKQSEHAALPLIKDFFKPRMRNVVENENEVRDTEIIVID